MYINWKQVHCKQVYNVYPKLKNAEIIAIDG